MKRYNNFLVLVFLSLNMSCANAPVRVLGTQEYGSIMFENDNYNEVLAASKVQNKPIFMDLYTNWCGWCKRLDYTTYLDPKVIKYVNANFIPLKVDAERGQGQGVKLKYGIHSYPRLLFLDSNGKALVTIEGYRDAKGLLYSAIKAHNLYNRK